jgi:hypothetical protein
MIPLEIQSDQELYSIHLRIQGLRGKLHAQLEEIRTGIYSSKRIALNIISDLLSTTSAMRRSIERYVIPSDQMDDFILGLESLDSYISDALYTYYNDTKKLDLYLQMIQLHLNEISSYQTINLSAVSPNQSEYTDGISEDDFITQGASSPTSEAITHYVYHTIGSNDTLQDIADYYYADRTRYREIMEVNDIRPSDLIDGIATGKSIKIPMPQGGLSQVGNNRVHEKQPIKNDRKSIEKFMYGVDIRMSNNRIIINGNSTANITGVDVVAQNIRHRLSSSKIGISSDPTWGIGAINRLGNVPYLVSLERHIQRAESQCLDDPRVTSASAPRARVKVADEILKYEIDLNLIGADEVKVKL